MRRLASELDVAPAAIYWHVDGRATLLDGIVEVVVERLRLPEAVELTAASRLTALAAAIREQISAAPGLVELLASEGRVGWLFGPLRDACFAELERRGVRGAPAAIACRAVVVHVAGFVTIEPRLVRYRAADGPEQPGAAGLDLPDRPGFDNVTVLPDDVFTWSMRTFMEAVFPDPTSS